jgi:hypothetical protein
MRSSLILVDDGVRYLSGSVEEEVKPPCPLCGSHGLRIFYSMENVPASCNRLWTNKYDALNCPKGDIRLAFCPNCMFISNIAVEPQKNQYDSQYDNSLFYSARFQDFARKLSAELVRRYGIYGKKIVEIGAGKVDFLSLMISLGNNCGFRFNPFNSKFEVANQATRGFDSSSSKSLTLLSEGKKVDFIFSYHELEHMNNPKGFLRDLRMAIAKNLSVRLFFSVPNVLKAFEDGDYTDVIYEHVSYFTIPSLHFLFSNCGFDISEIEESEGEIFDSIYVDATLKREETLEIDAVSENVAMQIEKTIGQFAVRSLENIRVLSKQLRNLLDEGYRVVIWGVGARGVTILNILKDKRIEYAVDINPRKQGLYVPGTGQKIVKPEFLCDYKPDFVLISNAPYGTEIRKTLDGLQIKAKFLYIHH